MNVEEREVILGFPRHFTVASLPKSEQGTTAHQDLRLTLLGNSWNVTVVTWLLGQLCQPLGLIPCLSVQQAIERTGGLSLLSDKTAHGRTEETLGGWEGTPISQKAFEPGEYQR